MSEATQQLFSQIKDRLTEAGLADPDGEAALIVRAAGEQKEQPVESFAWSLLERRTAGQSLAKLLGTVTFAGVQLLTAPGVIVPRPETELLAGTAIEHLRSLPADEPIRVIDLCCGAGNLACAIAVAVPHAQLWAADLTDDCVALTRRNVEHCGVGVRVRVAQGDLFAPFVAEDLQGQTALIVCNPPYISSGRLEKDSAALLDHEPREAFDGGPYGLSIHQRVIKESLAYLKPGGWLMFEIGLGQERQLKMLFKRARQYEKVEFPTDSAGQPRVARGMMKAV